MLRQSPSRASPNTCTAPAPLYSNENVANRDVRDFGWEIKLEAVSRRLPISLYTIEARVGSCTYDAKARALSIVQAPVFGRPVPNPNVTIRNFCIAVRCVARTA
jgi:hypothetical protein